MLTSCWPLIIWDVGMACWMFATGETGYGIALLVAAAVLLLLEASR